MLSNNIINNISATSSPSYMGPVCSILKTVKDTTTGQTWHKLQTNPKAIWLIAISKAYSSWEIKEDNTGRKYFWVTDKLLLLLKIQGLKQTDN